MVKGGTSGANQCTFNPAALCGDGLTTPTNPGGSLIDFCSLTCC